MSMPEAPPRRLTRSPSDRMVAGVCGGLAEFTGIDPVIFRVVVAVATLMGGAGLVAYGIAWLVIPSADDAQSHAESLLRDRHVPRIGLIGIGILALIITGSLDGWGNHWGGGGFGLLVVVAIGIWLWTRDDHTVPPRPPAPPVPPVPPSRPLVAAEIPADDVTVPVPPVPPTRHRPRRHRRPRRPRSKLLALTFSAVVLTTGILAAIDLSDAAQVHADTALAICLIVVGAGLLVGSVAGRPGGLFAIGLLLTAATAVAAVADVPLSGGAGDRYWQPTSLGALERTYELGAGDATLDLRRLDLGGRTHHVTAHVGFGDLRIWVPDGVHLVIDAHAGLGDVRVLGSVDHGVDVSRRAEVTGSGGTIEIDARVGMGQVEVIR